MGHYKEPAGVIGGRSFFIFLAEEKLMACIIAIGE
jgi:hypothetical protein